MFTEVVHLPNLSSIPLRLGLTATRNSSGARNGVFAALTSPTTSLALRALNSYLIRFLRMRFFLSLTECTLDNRGFADSM